MYFIFNKIHQSESSILLNKHKPKTLTSQVTHSMSSDNPPRNETNWSTIASRSAKARVPRPNRKYEKPGHKISQHIDIVFEDSEITDYLRTQRVTSIVQAALQPESILFSLPDAAFDKHTDAYQLIVSQLGPVVGNSFIPISVRGFQSRSAHDLVFSTIFCKAEDTQKAITEGITIDGIVYKGIPYKDRSAANDYIRVYLTLVRQENNVATLVQKLKASMSMYGKVLQIKMLLRDGFFEGEVSVVLTRKPEADVSYQPLQRMLFLEEWDVLVPARYTGADKVCYFCRKSGHIRNDCPVLKEITCRRCNLQGHTQRRCTTVLEKEEEGSRRGSTFSTQYEEYMQLTQETEGQYMDTSQSDIDSADLGGITPSTDVDIVTDSQEVVSVNETPVPTDVDMGEKSTVSSNGEHLKSLRSKYVNHIPSQQSSNKKLKSTPGKVAKITKGVTTTGERRLQSRSALSAINDITTDTFEEFDHNGDGAYETPHPNHARLGHD